MGEDFLNGLWLVSSLLGIILVLILTYFGSKWLVKRVNNVTSGQNIRILDRAFLGQDKYVAIVKVGNKQMLIGITSQKISKLCDLEESDGIVIPPQNSSTNDSFKNLLQNSIDNLTGKHRGKQDLENIDE